MRIHRSSAAATLASALALAALLVLDGAAGFLLPAPAATKAGTTAAATPAVVGSSWRQAGGVRSGSVRCQSAASASVAAVGLGLGSDDRAAALSALTEWYSKNGIKDAKVKVGASPSGTGLGLLATSSIKRGEQVLIVPLSLALSMDAVRAGPVGRATGGWEPNLGEAALIAVQLLYEAAQGDKSKYAAYLKALPRPGQDGFDHPLFWSAQELAVLSQSSTRNLKEQLVDACEADFAALQANVLAKGGIPGLSAQAVDLPTFKWAVATVLARSFFAEGGLRLCPLLDMANHGSVAQGNEPEPAGLGIFGGKGLRVVADRDYKAGEEVRISYGPKSGVEFLEDHGFVPALGEPEKEGMCELAFEVTEQDGFFDDKEDVLTMAGVGLRQAFDVRADGDVDEAMIQFLRLKCLRDKDAFLLEAVFRQEVWMFMDLPVSEDNENAVDELIISRCQAALDAFKDAQTLSLSALEAAGAGAGGPEAALTKQRLEAAARIRASEKAALEAAQAWAERDMTTTDIKQWYQERRLEALQLCGPLTDDEMAGSAGGRSARDLDW